MEYNKVIPVVLDKNPLLFLILSRFLQAMFTNNNRNVKCRIVIPLVLDENRSLFLNLSQHGLQIASDIRLIIKE